MIKNIVFDNGGVIVKYSAKTYLDYFNYEREKQEKLDTLFASDEWTKFAKGEWSSEDFKEFALKQFPEYTKEVIEILDVENLKFMIPPYKETLDFIDFLKKANYKVYLLTDINEDTIKYMKSEIEDFENIFDGIVYSCRVGMVKKDGKVFDYLLKTFDLIPEETLFLDDTVRNLEEANKYGIQTYRFLDPLTDIQKIKDTFLK